jgi:hypothetical protein
VSQLQLFRKNCLKCYPSYIPTNQRVLGTGHVNCEDWSGFNQVFGNNRPTFERRRVSRIAVIQARGGYDTSAPVEYFISRDSGVSSGSKENLSQCCEGGVGCTNRIKRLSVGINDWILTEDLSTNK